MKSATMSFNFKVKLDLENECFGCPFLIFNGTYSKATCLWNQYSLWIDKSFTDNVYKISIFRSEDCLKHNNTELEVE